MGGVRGGMALAIFSLSWLLLCGCMHYRPGHGSQLPFETVCVVAVKNDAFVPQMQAILSSQVRQKLSRCFRLSDRADATLEITIVSFGQSIATTMPDDSIRAKSFMLNATVRCSLLSNKTGEYWFKDHTIGADIECQTAVDYQWNKTQAIPKLSLKLAEKISDIVCNPW
jgi:hypothetical protein